MNYPKNIWTQLKNKSPDDFIKALKKDGWIRDFTKSAEQLYLHPIKNRRVIIHYHPKKTYQQKLLKALLKDIGWTIEEMKNLKFVK